MRSLRPTQTRVQRLGPGADEWLSLLKVALVLSTSNQLFGISLLKHCSCVCTRIQHPHCIYTVLCNANSKFRGASL